MDQQDKIKVSIIVSVYNEQEVLKGFWEELYAVLSVNERYSWNVIFVNDGSKDESQNIINSILENSIGPVNVQSLEFSRNFGHEAAMIAGIDSTEDDAVICLDADLQHPPSKIQAMLDEYEKGEDVVLMKRLKRHDNGLVKNFFSNFFYKIIVWLSNAKFEQSASDFFLISKPVVDVLKNNFRERNRFLRGVIQVIGFNLTTVDYESPVRFGGESNYTFGSLLKLGFTAIFAFSNKPLALSYIFSGMFMLFSAILSFYTIGVYFFGDTPTSGYTTIIIFQSIGFTVLCVLISILSMYFGRTLEEIRNRPIYLVKRIRNSKK